MTSPSQHNPEEAPPAEVVILETPARTARPYRLNLLVSGNWRSGFTAFRHRNFRLYFVGLLVSVTGFWAQSIAQDWLVYDLTRSPLVLGQVSFVAAIPVLLFGPWAGLVIDRFPRRDILLVTQTVQMLQAFALAYLTFTGRIEVWHIAVLSGVRGLANAFDAPTRQSFVIEMVGKEDLSNAIALNSTMFSLARFVGPLIGTPILLLGAAWAFTVNGVTFLAIIASLLMMRLAPAVLHGMGHSPWGDMLDGFRFIGRSRSILALMFIALAVSIFGANFSTLMPVVAREVLHGGEMEFGMMRTANGLGSIVGALIVAYMSSRPGRGRRLNLLNLVFPLTLVGFAMSSTYGWSLISLFAIGASYLPQLSLCNMLIQSNIPDEMRGRVMSVYTLIIFGAFPLGSLIGGAMADGLGAPLTIALNAAAVLMIAIGMRFAVPRLRTLE